MDGGVEWEYEVGIIEEEKEVIEGYKSTAEKRVQQWQSHKIEVASNPIYTQSRADITSGMLDLDDESRAENMPMLIGWTHKHVDDEVVVRTSLSFLLSLSPTEVGCQQMVRHHAPSMLLAVREEFPQHEEFQLMLAQLFGALFSHPSLHHSLLGTSSSTSTTSPPPPLLHASITILYRQLNQRDTALECMRCVDVAARVSETSRSFLFSSSLVGFVTGVRRMMMMMMK